MKLYHARQSRSIRPRWLLEEIGVPYELVTLDMSKQEHKAPDYLKIHPHGALPALVDGDLALIESAAICAYLADKYPEKRLAPPVGSPVRGPYYQWIVYTIATMEPPLIDVFMNTVRLPEAERSPAKVEAGRVAWKKVAEVLSGALQGKQYLLGNEFSTADVMVGSTLAWGQFLGLLEGFPVLQEYVGRLASRPAFVRAQE
ncbi:glutathione S-transferase family protein [Candidatus Binatia bacterium]|nr:glutathione S-transferase family protein [Candidatus Binatia bacterium]